MTVHSMGFVWLAAALALTACDGKKNDAAKDEAAEDDDDGEKKKKKKKKKADRDEDDAKAAAKEAPKDETAVANEPPPPACGPPNEIPDIPADRSDPPSLAEWATGCDVNTQGAGSQAGDCTLKIKREWLQVTCRGEVKGYEELEGFGSEGLDYFKQIVPGQLASFVVRLRKGKSQKVRICRDKERASLFVSWPPANAKPTIVALGVGPACDGSSFGAR
jgi:hypothetical protein